MKILNKYFPKKFSVRIVFDFKGINYDYFNVEYTYYRFFPLYEPVKTYGTLLHECYDKLFKLEYAEYFAKNLTIEKVMDIEKENKLSGKNYLEKRRKEEVELENYRKPRYIK